MHKHTVTRAMSPALEAYKMQTQGAVLYGSEFWGYQPSNTISKAENDIRQNLAVVPSSIPLIPLYLDLDVKSISDLAQLRPLLCWYRLWSTPELECYQLALRDLINLDHSVPPHG
mgnify:CR=1 FL=1